MRVEGPVKVPEFNPNRDLATVQNAGKRLQEGKSLETVERASAGQVNLNQIDSAAELTNRAMEIGGFNLQFRVHNESGRVQVKVVEKETKEVIREIPPEQMLEIAAQIRDIMDNLHEMVGVLVNELV